MKKNLENGTHSENESQRDQKGTNASPPDTLSAAFWRSVWQSRWRVPTIATAILILAVFAVWSSLPDERKAKLIEYFLPSEECKTLNAKLVSPIYGQSNNQCEPWQQKPEPQQSVDVLFFSANPEFISFVEPILTNKVKDEDIDPLSFVLAPAGTGKSFIFRRLKKTHPALQIYQTKECNYKYEKLSTLKPDSDAQPVLGSHKKFELPKDLTLLQFLNACRGSSIEVTRIPRVIGIDGFDEVHPDTAFELASLVRKHIEAAESKSHPKHVFLIGRPEGFIGFFRDPRAESDLKLRRFELVGPLLNSTMSVASRVNEYRELKKRQGLPLADTSNEVAMLTRKYDWLCDSMRNLHLGNLIIANAATYVGKLSDGSETGLFDVRDLLFQELLARNKDSHDRPDGNHDLYVRLLEAVAVNYSRKLEPDGYFYVGARDSVTVEKSSSRPSDGTITFLVVDILNFSGIAYLKPFDYANTRYKFSPAWLHHHLVEKHNRRIKDALVAKSCS